jgi:stress response protein YsnF
MDQSKNKRIIQVVLLKDTLSNFSYYADNQTISDDYLNQNFKVVYMPS